MKALSDLCLQEEAVIISTECEHLRLCDLGFTEGTMVKCVLKSPLGDPSAYIIRGAVIAVRKSDASKVKVEVCHSE